MASTKSITRDFLAFGNAEAKVVVQKIHSPWVPGRLASSPLDPDRADRAQFVEKAGDDDMPIWPSDRLWTETPVWGYDLGKR